jgi:adenosylmethionine-8-amino-7-oxononanoate aminotransferase
MQSVCERHGALLVLDEVMSGMGRTGTLHAWQQEGVVPDVQTIGKGLGGGYAPIAGVLVGPRVVETLDKGTGKFVNGFTYQGHALSCAAALAVQRVIQSDSLLANVRDMGTFLGEQLQKALASSPWVGNVRGRGLFWGVRLSSLSLSPPLMRYSFPTIPCH